MFNSCMKDTSDFESLSSSLDENSFKVRRIDERERKMDSGILKITDNGLEFHRVSLNWDRNYLIQFFKLNECRKERSPNFGV